MSNKISKYYTKGYIGLDDEDDLKRSFRREQPQDFQYKNRFQSFNYIRQLATAAKTYNTRKEVILKIISKGIGKKHLNILLSYVQRELSYQKEQKLQAVELEDAYGKIYRGKEVLILTEAWAEEFKSHQNIKDPKLYEELEKYSARVGELEGKKLDGEISFNEDSELAFLKKKSPLKKKMEGLKKDFTHIVFSAGDKPNEKKYKRAMRNFLEDHFKGQGYEYVFAFHNDTANSHFHVIVKNSNILVNKKHMNLNKQQIFALKQGFNQYLERSGISRISTKKFDRIAYLKELQQTPEKIEKRIYGYYKNLDRKEEYYSFNALKFRQKLINDTNLYIKKLKKSESYGNNFKKEIKKLNILKKDIETLRPHDFFKIKAKTLKELGKDNRAVAESFKNYFSEPVNKVMTQKQKKAVLSMAINIEDKVLKELEETLVIAKDLRKNTKDKTAKQKIDLFIYKVEDIVNQGRGKGFEIEH